MIREWKDWMVGFKIPRSRGARVFLGILLIVMSMVVVALKISRG